MAIWEPKDSSLDPEIRFGTRRPYENPEVLDHVITFGTRRLLFRSGDHIWNPEAIQEPRGSSLDPEIFSWNPEAVWEPGGSSLDFIHRARDRLGNRTVLRLPRQNYYWYLFGSCIMPLGSWALSSSYVVFYFCRKSLTDLGGAGTGPGELHSGEPGFLLAGTQSLPLIARFRHRTWGITCALKSTGVAHSQQASLRQNIAPMGKLWASDDILETVELGSLMFPEEELMC
ncbi:hypothetical protein DY000_02007544 [Brassica cretica]|uniref:Uncharacterized protein n=1 Tax=Brassica cretica TaxID=69181 RepID=A0ABQ7CCA6_BRACR|nr:hypothetical protein DY000_02007544 [Brassica cretica]